MIEPERVTYLNGREPVKGAYVLYWMQASQRAAGNHSLEYAVNIANERHLPLVVCFGLTEKYPEANERHYRFMLEGLRETAAILTDRGIAFIVRRGDPVEITLELAGDASVVVCDRGYLRFQDQWRREVADKVNARLFASKRTRSYRWIPLPAMKNIRQLR
jgi:deoxyribodipyrimidine photo-lyase